MLMLGQSAGPKGPKAATAYVLVRFPCAGAGREAGHGADGLLVHHSLSHLHLWEGAAHGDVGAQRFYHAAARISV